MNFFRRHWFIVALVAIAGAARIAILLYSQTHVHNDEAVIGLMAKHISEGRYFPFYMYGQAYNAAAAGEAYLAALSFKLFGISVVALKGVTVFLSLGCLFFLYKMAETWYGRRTAALAAVAFALAPSLLKWHFQVRGYSFYFLAIPLLLILFWQSVTAPTIRRLFLFGLISGLSIWCLELSFPLIAALWVLVLLWRRMSVRQAALAVAGFLVGYLPAIIYNVAHHFENWRAIVLHKTGSAALALVHPFNLQHFLFDEMPKFFGPDTVVRYFPEKPWTGLVFYAIALLAIAMALLPLNTLPSRFRAFFSGDVAASDGTKDLVMLFLTGICFVPYLLSPSPTPRYFLGGIFFLSILSGRLLGRCFASRTLIARTAGIATLAAILVAGIGAMVDVARRNEIETLTLCANGRSYCVTRIPGANLEAVENHLRTQNITSAWTSVPLTYPLIFETGEALDISDAIFGWKRNLFPKSIPLPEPAQDQPAVFVMETNSPLRAKVEHWLADSTGEPPLVTEYGVLAVIAPR